MTNKEVWLSGFEYGRATQSIKGGLTVVLEGDHISAIVTNDPELVGIKVLVIDYDCEDADNYYSVLQSDGRAISVAYYTTEVEKSEIVIND